ncbi:MAG: ATP-dependent helicase, partial [Acidilobaceae archaeon]
LVTVAMEEPEAGLKLLEARKLGAHADKIIKILSDTRKLWGITPSFSSPVIEEVGGQSILHVCLGSKGNFALALLLSKIMEKFKPVEFSHIPYAIVFKSPTGVKGGLVAAALREAKSLDSVERLAFIHDSLRRSKAFTARFYHVAQRMGVIDVDAKVGAGLLGKMVEAYRGSVVERETLRELVVDKLDVEALNQFLEALEEPQIVVLREPSPLTLHVLGNPYIRGDVSVNIKLIALDQIIEAKKKHLNSKTVTLLCAMCADTLTIKVSDARKDRMKCGKCGNSLLAPLPDSEWGRQAIEIYVKHLKEKKLSKEEKKVVEEVKDRAGLYLN